MVSDVTEDVTRAAAASPPPLSPPQPQSKPVAPPAYGSQPSNSGKKGMGGIGWLFAGVIGLAVLIFNTGERSSLPAPPDASPSFAMPAEGSPAPTPSEALPVAASNAGVEKPPIGRNKVLSAPQIRYCMTERIRIDAVESVVNTAYDHEVDLFNASVADYNSRCGEFRYRDDDVERVRRELNAVSASIASAARSEWVRSSLGLNTPSRNPADLPIPAQQKSKPRQEASCQNDGECPGSLICIRRECGPQVSYGGVCDRDIECEGASHCVSGRCTNGEGSPAFTLVMPTPQPVKQEPKSSMPANAEPDYTGRTWQCKRGYRPVNGQCEAVQMPANAEIDYTGRNWKCSYGYRPVNGQCEAVQMPANAEIDYTGRNWKCSYGYRPVNGQCEAVQKPANAEIDYTGRNWKCSYGYRQSGNACIPL